MGINIVGYINPLSRAEHRFILMLVDYATKYAEIIPLRKINVNMVAQALTDIYSRLGVPEEVLADQEMQFMFDGMREDFAAP
ncbi:integrase core domain [Plakobranchus ocellatus]|uniref:Integrase core domain n=1 Tax=Plakobranchus ocellatus TaxID=259542 RepID=A0AAV3ZDQ3_9GAST|nr:integrase core domain [Plakobranchus ocellatus]